MTDETSNDRADTNGFPSGAWVGFYTYQFGGARHRMDLSLEFHRALITGDGMDDVGKFLIRGQFEAVSRDCWWFKSYPQSHQVSYRGRFNGRSINGRWELMTACGNFCIWPKAAGDLTGEFFVEESDLSVDVALRVPATAVRVEETPVPVRSSP